MEVLKMLEKNHFCEFEVAEELVFCKVCGKTAEVMSE